jgi:hypothetical protein
MMEDGEYVPKMTVTELEKATRDGEIFFCKPPRGWPPAHFIAEQQSSLSADAHTEQQEEVQEHEQDAAAAAAAAAGRRAKQQKAKQERRKAQQSYGESAAAADEGGAADVTAHAQQAGDEHAEEQQAQPAKQQHHQQQQKQRKQHQQHQQQRPHQQQKKLQQQQHGSHGAAQGHKQQRKHSAGAAGGSRPAGAKLHPPPSPAVLSAEAAAAATAAATAATAGLSTPGSAGTGAGQQRPRSASVKPQQQQQQPDLSGLTGDAARLASSLVKLHKATEAVKRGLALQQEALDEVPTGLSQDELIKLATSVKSAMNSSAIFNQLKQLVATRNSLQDSKHVLSDAEQLYQQLQRKQQLPGTPRKALPEVKQEGESAAAAAAAAAAGTLSLQDMEAAAAAGVSGLGKRGRDGSIRQEPGPAAAAAAAAAEQRSPSEQQDGDEEAAAAGGVDASGKDTWDMAFVQSLVPVRALDDPLRDTAVALLSAVLQPPAAASPFALAHELEAMLHNQHGMIGPGKHMYLRHLYYIWCVLGGRELTAAAEAAQRAREAAAEAAANSNAEGAAAAAAAAAADKAAAAALAELEGVPGVADAAGVRTALLEGAASVEELFAMTRTQLGFDQQRDK